MFKFLKIISIYLFLSGLIYGEGFIDTYTVNLTPSSISVNEGDSGTKAVSLHITIDKCPSSGSISVNYYTQNGTAKSGSDYNSKSGTVTFDSGNCDKDKVVKVYIKGDKEVEDNEYFYFKISLTSFFSFNVNISNNSSKINIKNDDEEAKEDVDLYIYKWSDVKRVQKNKTFWYGVGIGYSTENNGDTKAKVIDNVPSDLEVLEVDDNGYFNCSINGNKVTCITKKNIEDYGSEPEFLIKVRAKVAHKNVKNTATVTHLNSKYEEVYPPNNTASVTVYTLGENEKDEVSILKEVINPKNSYDVGENIKFRIKVTNVGYKKKIAMRDKFPIGSSSWGTTGNAFKLISYTKPNDVICEEDKEDNDPYLFCYTKNKYNDGDSFTVTITAKILKGGKICNTAHGYEYYWIWKDSSQVCINAEGNGAPILTKKISNQVKYINQYMKVVNLNQYFKDPEGKALTYSVSGLPANAYYDKKNKKIRGKLTEIGDFTVTVTATDPEGASTTTTFKIKVKPRKLKAKSDKYKISINTKLEDNVIKNDRGYQIKLISHTNPSHGTLTIKENGDFVYIPDYNFIGKDKFKYTITDISKKESSAWVEITISTTYHPSFVDFKILNPQDTRNVLGNYVIIGNTLSCVTSSKNNYGAKCVDDYSFNNNNYMVKYIDIDNNPKTWNSSSSNFVLPESYVENKGILWAGLFWQGSVNNFYQGTKQRRARLEDGEIKYSYVTANSSDIDFNKIGADKVWLKIDNNQTYIEIKASDFYYDALYGSKGGFYAAYADITTLLNKFNLSQGKHTITVANVLSNEGKDKEVGNYAGWSIVIIYKESGFVAKPKNISVYGGYVAMGEGNKVTDIKISGFRLPKYNKVNSVLSLFSGEGDYLYGGDPKRDYDEMYLKEKEGDKGELMPNARDPYNIFDAIMNNIDRDNIKNNNLKNNNNGIDVDSYDVTSIMTKFRDNNKKIDSVILGMKTDGDKSGSHQTDYFTPSMIAFSTDLYAPKLCYDYSVKLGDYIKIDSEDRNITVSNLFNKDLLIKVMIHSQEADFDIKNAKMYIEFLPDNVFEFDNAKVSLPNKHVYLDVTPIDQNEGIIPIGEDLSSNGGTISAKETIYSKLYYKFLKDRFEGKFNIVLEGDILFDGKHPVHYVFSTGAPKDSSGYIGRCPINPVYNPVYKMFNVERGDSKFSQPEAQRYSLRTQVTGIGYDISLASYQKDSNGEFKKESTSNAVVELELIDASNFENNSSAEYDSTCEDPDTVSKNGLFVDFAGKSRVKLSIPKDFPGYPMNVAMENATFRMWVLTKKTENDNEIVYHKCKDSSDDNNCFLNLYKDVYQSYESNHTKLCESSCKSSNSQCYKCLKENYAIAVCARDNFAIRPESFYIQVNDSNETKSKVKSFITDNENIDSKDIAAGYKYDLDINATVYSTHEKSLNYYFVSDENSSMKISRAIFTLKDNLNCVDRNDSKLNILIVDGTTSTVKKDANSSLVNLLKFDNVGNYTIHLEDRYWTRVDQKYNPLKPFKNIADCISGSTLSYGGKMKGCVISSQTDMTETIAKNDINLNVHPYKFKLDNITVSSNPNKSKDYIYINNLNSTKNLIKTGKVMSLNIQGNIEAVGKDDKILSNYKNGCVAKDLSIDIKYLTEPNQIKSLYKANVPILYSLYNGEVDGNSVEVDEATLNNNILSLIFKKKYFNKDGRGLFNLYFNYSRDFNDPINPFDVTIRDFNTSSKSETMSVDLTNRYPYGDKDFNITKRFYYAKVKSSKDFYDDIDSDKVKTPIEIDIFCNKSLEYCKKYDINVTNGITNEYDWFRNINYDASEAIVELSSSVDEVVVEPNIVDDFIKGIDENVTVKDNSSKQRPFEVKIKPADSMINNYPWLLFNKSLNSAPEYLYKVRFVNHPGAWSGQGKTGHTINENSSGKKTNRVDW